MGDQLIDGNLARELGMKTVCLALVQIPLRQSLGWLCLNMNVGGEWFAHQLNYK